MINIGKQSILFKVGTLSTLSAKRNKWKRGNKSQQSPPKSSSIILTVKKPQKVTERTRQMSASTYVSDGPYVPLEVINEEPRSTLGLELGNFGLTVPQNGR